MSMIFTFFTALTIIVTSAQQTINLAGEPERAPTEVGRIKSFDDLLLMYGRELHEASALERLLEEMERLAKDKKLIKEHTSYYVQTLKRLMETGTSTVLNQEQKRLNAIITSASYQPDGDIEVQYALVRRNIVGAFVDSIADHVMKVIEEDPEMAFENMKIMANIVGRKGEEEDEEEDKEEGGGRIPGTDEL